MREWFVYPTKISKRKADQVGIKGVADTSDQRDPKRRVESRIPSPVKLTPQVCVSYQGHQVSVSVPLFSLFSSLVTSRVPIDTHGLLVARSLPGYRGVPKSPDLSLGPPKCGRN